jgi:RNA polymerase sigma factor (sigma-70 family)
MTQDILDEHLSRISTCWSLVRQMHHGPAAGAASAQRQLMQRYCGAVYRYLLGALCDEEAALELFQDFALHFVRGDFRRADPQRGRFRDYLRTALIHLVRQYRAARRARPGPLPSGVPDPRARVPEPGDEEFAHSWREELVNRAWEALAEARPTFHAVLLLRVQQPDLPSPQMAGQLAAQLGSSFTASRVRVTLHRAREKFAGLLLDEVAHSLEAPTEAGLFQELRELRLLKICRPALKRRLRPCRRGAGACPGRPGNGPQ